MKLFVGLGNPGAKYAHNRHNIGFMAVQQIAAEHGFGPWRSKFQGQVSEGSIGGEKVILLCPTTYMNESGRSVGEAARFYKVPIGDVVVLYDEIDLAPGKMKVKVGGGAAGHNGLRSISAHMENDYIRVRIGVGHPGHKDRVANWVLSDFAKADKVWLVPLLEAVAKSAGRLASGDNERFMTDVALTLQADDADPLPATSTPAGSKREKAETTSEATPAKRSGAHPAGERTGKRQSALAENLKKWMKGRTKGSSDE